MTILKYIQRNWFKCRNFAIPTTTDFSLTCFADAYLNIES